MPLGRRAQSAAIERHEVGSGAIYTWRRQAMSGALTGITNPAVPSFAEVQINEPAVMLPATGPPPAGTNSCRGTGAQTSERSPKPRKHVAIRPSFGLWTMRRSGYDMSAKEKTANDQWVASDCIKSPCG